MRDQNDIVERLDPTSGSEFHRPFSDGAEQGKVISQITCQEDRRTNERGNHASDVHPFLVPTNGDPSHCDKAGAESVQRRVHWRKIKDIHLAREPSFHEATKTARETGRGGGGAAIGERSVAESEAPGLLRV